MPAGMPLKPKIIPQPKGKSPGPSVRLLTAEMTNEPANGKRKSRGPIARVTQAVTGRVVETIDPDTVLDHVDIDHLLDRIDINKLLDRVAPDRLLERVDPNAFLDRISVDQLLNRIDIDVLLDRVDIDRLLDRVDVNRLVEKIDIDALLEGVDLEAAVRRAGVPEIVAESTSQLTGSAIDLGRRQLVGLDVVVDRVVNRLMRRDPEDQPVGPPLLVVEPT